jgi:hypothetical protein
VYLLVFHAYIKEMHGSRSKIPGKCPVGSVARRDLIPALKGLTVVGLMSTPPPLDLLEVGIDISFTARGPVSTVHSVN